MKRRTVAYSPEARHDLIDLGDWIAEHAGTDVALNYIERLEAYCSTFEFSGEGGQRRDDIRSGLRIVGFEKRVAIAFVVTDSEVTILRPYYGGRHWLG